MRCTFIKRIGLAVLTLVVGLLLTEGAVRLLKLAPALRIVDTSDPDSPYKRSDNPILGYEHKANYRNPNADLVTSFPRTNAHGQRDVERSLEKPDGVRRVILLGDSVVESMEVRDIEQVMHRQLERLYPDSSVEVLNFGVNGYCTLAEIELLRTKGLAFRPDVVIVLFVRNDFFNLNTAMHAFASRPHRSAAVKGLFKRSHLFRAICIPLNLFGFAADANSHQWNTDAIGTNNVVAGLTKLKALAAENGFLPAIAIWPTLEESQILDSPTVGGSDQALIIERLATFHGIPTFRLSDHFAQDHAARGASVGPRDTYTNGDGMHANEEGSRVAASALKAVLDVMADPSRAAQPRPSAADYAHALSIIRDTEEEWVRTSKVHTLRVDEVASLADNMAERGRLEDAIELCRKALAIDGENSPAIHESLADALQFAGRFEEAISHYRETLRSVPNRAETQHKWGLALDRLGRHQFAVDHYQLALLLDPSLADAHYDLGNALLKLTRHEEAATNYQRATQLKPDFADAHINRGIALYNLGRVDEAFACGKEAARLAPAHANVRFNLAMMYLDSGQAGAAVEHFEQALKHKPDYTQAREGLQAARAMMRADSERGED
ncbi:MAG: tetratricopeptide repeat protein [Verrucomicrobia bacterium]|jgi:tetratricopeptide (TPR) repeat protein|nr:tetratricopeptide repeat protein [Verrucomicrobiota bacterium]